MKRQSPMQRLGTEPCQPPQTMQFSKLGTGSSLLSFSSEFFLKFLFFFSFANQKALFTGC